MCLASVASPYLSIADTMSVLSYSAASASASSHRGGGQWRSRRRAPLTPCSNTPHTRAPTISSASGSLPVRPLHRKSVESVGAVIDVGHLSNVLWCVSRLKIAKRTSPSPFPSHVLVTGTQPGADAPATENAPDKGVTPKKVHAVIDSEGRAVPITPLPDYPGGAVRVNRLEFIANVKFRLDAGGLPCALAPQEEPSPLVTTVGNIWRAAQRVRARSPFPTWVRVLVEWNTGRMTSV
jgi:hypothetical protein